MGLIPGSGRYPGEGNGNPLQYSSPGNLMNRGNWWATVHRVTKSSDMTEHTHTHTHTHTDTHTHKVNIPTGIVSWVPARNMPLTRVIAQCITLWSIQFLVQVQIRGNFCFSNIACRRNLTLIRLMWEQA